MLESTGTASKQKPKHEIAEFYRCQIRSSSGLHSKKYMRKSCESSAVEWSPMVCRAHKHRTDNKLLLQSISLTYRVSMLCSSWSGKKVVLSSSLQIWSSTLLVTITVRHCPSPEAMIWGQMYLEYLASDIKDVYRQVRGSCQQLVQCRFTSVWTAHKLKIFAVYWSCTMARVKRQ